MTYTLTATIRASNIRPGDLIQSFNNGRRWPTAKRVTAVAKDDSTGMLVFTLFDGTECRIFPMSKIAFDPTVCSYAPKN
jgi:hypothetical protein